MIFSFKDAAYADLRNIKPPHDEKTYQLFVGNSVDNLIDVTDALPGFEKLNVKLRKSKSTVTQKMLDVMQLKENEFHTICHGDMWANNVMFQHNKSGHVDKVLFVDFQICGWNSPVFDLMHSLCTSSGENICEQDWDEIIAHYHKNLTRTLIALKYKQTIPSLADIKKQILEKNICAALIGVLCVGVRKLENVGDAGVEMFMRTGDADRRERFEMVMKQTCRKSVEFLLGYIDRNVDLN